jgi:hypothetical protein
MHVWLDAPAISSDGVTVGHVSRLLVHPASWKVLAIAVRGGRFLRHVEMDVPLEMVRDASPQGVWLELDGLAFQGLPHVRQAAWRRPPRQWVTPLGWPAGRVFWPANYAGAVYPEITTAQLRGWGTLRAALSNTPRAFVRPAEPPAPLPTATTAFGHVPEQAAARLEIELARERRGESLVDVDPYDVLARPSECGFNTAFERDDASIINPQPGPGL